MKTAFLIIFITLGNTRKEAAKRWPAPAEWSLKVDQTKPTYVYELSVKVLRWRNPFPGAKLLCAWTWMPTYTGASWQAVLDKSKEARSECTEGDLK